MSAHFIWAVLFIFSSPLPVLLLLIVLGLRFILKQVPFLDICNTMLDPTLPLTVLDYEEFGDPNNPAEFEAIYSYSPYDNLSSEVCYPPVLVTASFNDTRFVPSHLLYYEKLLQTYFLGTAGGIPTSLYKLLGHMFIHFPC
jgi:hypothetical protein